jgi:putative ABC transport system permease protein
MVLLYKQLTKEISRNRLFVLLMLILTILTSFMFFFVQFSVDGNITALNTLPSLNENQTLYKNALTSNNILALDFLLALTALTSFVFLMFFYRFLKTNKKQIGCIKSLGFKDHAIYGYFIIFTIVLSILGAFVGLCAGYYASSILIHSNEQSYAVTGLVRKLHVNSILTGFLLPTATLCVAALFSYGQIHGKDSGVLLAGINNELKFSGRLRYTNMFINKLPFKNNFSIRLALRKPVTVVLIVIATMCLNVMFILGYSINKSSETIYKSQTDGHSYLFDTQYENYLIDENPESTDQMYLTVPGKISKKGSKRKVEQQIVGLEQGKTLLLLKSTDKNPIPNLKENFIYIGPSLQQLYGFKTGDILTLSLNGQDYSLKAHIAANAASSCVYITKDTLARLLALPDNSYNGVLSMQSQNNGGIETTLNQKLEELDRASVSNRSSAVINQVIGCVVGCILLFLALLLNFGDSERDIIILHLIGYKARDIKKMLIDIYKPILLLSFALTLWPSIVLAQTIQKNLSFQTGDYMPFQTNTSIISVIFILLYAIYFLVQATFLTGVRSVIKQEKVFEYTNAI